MSHPILVLSVTLLTLFLSYYLSYRVTYTAVRKAIREDRCELNHQRDLEILENQRDLDDWKSDFQKFAEA
jgi:hypothetical protein